MSEPVRPSPRARLSRRGMTLGVAMMLGGAILRFGAGPLGLGASAADSVASPAPGMTPRASGPGPLASPGGPPADAGTWFADDFTAEAAWPVGALGLVLASVADGRYVLEAEATDLPVIILAAAGAGAPGKDGGSVQAQVELTIAAGDAATGAGPVLEDAAGTRLMVLVAADGRIGLYRDSIESLDLLASASVAPPAGAVTVGLRLDGGKAIVLADGVAVASAVASLAPVGVGLAIWSPTAVATLAFDAYRVWSPAPA